ncbi:MAG TPA: hypothetical protein PKA41_02900 [Verrucomicrobiota bacterium]|mgnify:CR=1 FL=1|nr:hypothetical protein [Verrucomicrobiota bacterium]
MTAILGVRRQSVATTALLRMVRTEKRCRTPLATAVQIAVVFVTLLLHVVAFAQETVESFPAVRFRTVDIFVDSKGAPLAAYQIEFAVTNGNAKIVGIEGGENPAFTKPPYYDPKAMQQDRAIIAAFSTAATETLPKEKTRVATIHLQTTGAEELKFDLKLQTAADAGGNKIQAEANAEERKSK